MNVLNMQDAQQRAMAFMVQQAALIEPTVYQIKYEDLVYPQMIPVDTSAPEWISTVTYFSLDGVGKAEWFAGAGDDVPHVELGREKFETTVSMGSIGYGYNLEELGKAMLYGIQLTDEKARLARRAAEEMINRVAFLGDTAKGLKGLFNSAAPTADTVPADGTGSSTTFGSKSADFVLRDINVALSGTFNDTKGAELADTLILPWSTLQDLSFRRIDSVNSTTIIEWVRANNIYTLQTRQPLTIMGHWGLETAGSSSSKRLVAYRRSPEVLKMHIPMRHRFIDPMRTGPLIYEVPGIFRLGGLDVKRPAYMRYVDGISEPAEEE